jgi:hypothetical protein
MLPGHGSYGAVRDPRSRWIAVVVAVLAVPALGAATADAKLGPAPQKCGAEPGGSGCYGRDKGPNFLDDTGGGELTVSPKIVTAGQPITATAVNQAGPQSITVNILGKVCTFPALTGGGTGKTSQGSCTVKTTAANGSPAWQIATMTRGDGGRDNEAFAVLPKDKGAISGTIRDGEGKPMGGVTVAINGPQKGSVKTNESGFYQHEVSKKGRYTVAPAADVCALPLSGACARTRTVTAPPSAGVDFVQADLPRLEVTVTPKQPVIEIIVRPDLTFEPVATSATVTVRNTGRQPATGIQLGKLGLLWKGQGKAPSPLGLRQTAGPTPPGTALLAPGDSFQFEYALAASGDGVFDLQATATGKAPSGSAIKGTGAGRLTTKTRCDNADPLTPPVARIADTNCARISGRVVDSFGEGVGNVKLVATPSKGRKLTRITPENGYFTFTLTPPSNVGKVVIVPDPVGDDKITPDKLTVTVAPGKTAFARFDAEVGIVSGEVAELLCPEPVTPTNCRKRIPRSGAVVELSGTGVRQKKFDRTRAEGSADKVPFANYRFKVPPGRYKVLVNRLDVGDPRHQHICRADPRLPVVTDTVEADRPAACAARLKNSREEVPVTVEKGKKADIDFLAVPKRLLPALEFVTFPRNSPVKKPEVMSGLTKPEKPYLFGELIADDKDWPTLHCRTGCAVLSARVTNLLGEPLSPVDGSFTTTSINPGFGVPLEDEDGNTDGKACVVARGKEVKACFHIGTANRDGRVLGIYAAPGIVPGPSLEDARPDAPVTASVGFRAAPGEKLRDEYPREESVTETLRIKPNPQFGSSGPSVTLDAGDATVLNMLTDPDTVKNGVKTTLKAPGAACEQFQKFFLDKVMSKISNFCDKVDVPGKVSDAMFELLDDKALSLMVIEMFGVNQSGLLNGIGLPGIPTSPTGLIPRFTTRANDVISGWLRAWRIAHGEAAGGAANPIRAGEKIQFEIFEVSRMALRNNSLVNRPAVYLTIRSPGYPARGAAVVSKRYDPVKYLK